MTDISSMFFESNVVVGFVNDVVAAAFADAGSGGGAKLDLPIVEVVVCFGDTAVDALVMPKVIERPATEV